MTFPELASSRETVLSSAFATHTDPCPTAMPSGNAPTAIGRPTNFPVLASNADDDTVWRLDSKHGAGRRSDGAVCGARRRRAVVREGDLTREQLPQVWLH